MATSTASSTLALSGGTTDAEGFKWPGLYDFPPFFTIQLHHETRKKQLDMWCSLVLAYFRHHRRHALDIGEEKSGPLFTNARINRRLSPDAIVVVLEELARQGRVEWRRADGGAKTRCWVMWRTPAEWADVLGRWAADRGLANAVCTLYELTDGEDTAREDFHGMDRELLVRVLKVLQQQKLAELMGDEGVKFF